SREVNGNKFLYRRAGGRARETPLQEFAQINCRRGLEAFRFIDRLAQPVPQPKRQRQVWTDLPGVLSIEVVLVSSVGANNRISRIQNASIQLVIDVGSVLRVAPDNCS